ncbi:hypothetical protein BGS_0478 [Beggiatoa sp. SS]|nr:hypothetical protein BGS_0478 [Beggiatoa sp. SS]
MELLVVIHGMVNKGQFVSPGMESQDESRPEPCKPRQRGLTALDSLIRHCQTRVRQQPQLGNGLAVVQRSHDFPLFCVTRLR